jgi:putative ABC transport system substrate-binding protein
LASVAGAALCGGARAAGTKLRRVGWLSQGLSSEPPIGGPAPFRDALRERGWSEGRDIAVVYRFAEGNPDRLPGLASELVRSDVEVIVAPTPSAIAAARQATATIPIVMVYGPDPAESGIVATLARPGGNVTGLTSLSVDVSVKQLELVKEILPALSTVGVLWNPTNPWHRSALPRLDAAAKPLGVRLTPVGVANAREIDSAVTRLVNERVGAALVLADPLTFEHRARLAGLATNQRLPMIAGLTAYTEAGSLASYWPDSAQMFERAAGYVDRILRGARPADLPIEQPTKFELAVNVRTANALGVAIPRAVMVRADRVFE